MKVDNNNFFGRTSETLYNFKRTLILLNIAK